MVNRIPGALLALFLCCCLFCRVAATAQESSRSDCAAPDALPSAIALRTSSTLEIQPATSEVSRLSVNLANLFWLLSKADEPVLYPQSCRSAERKSENEKGFADHVKALGNYVFSTRGLEMSVEGANLGLDETEKLSSKSDCAGVYLLELAADRQHYQVSVALLALAAALGAPAKEERSMELALDRLEKLVGKIETDRVLAELGKAASDQGDDTDRDGESDRTLDGDRRAASDRGVESAMGVDSGRRAGSNRAVDGWSLDQISERVGTIASAALERDAVAAKLRQDLSAYAGRSQTIRKSTRVVSPALGIAALTPTILAPIAGVADLTCMMANGGPEQDKLLNELYLTKALNDRRRTIESEAHLAVDALLLSRSSGNRLLYRSACGLIEHLAGAPAVSRVITAGSELAM